MEPRVCLARVLVSADSSYARSEMKQELRKKTQCIHCTLVRHGRIIVQLYRSKLCVFIPAVYQLCTADTSAHCTHFWRSLRATLLERCKLERSRALRWVCYHSILFHVSARARQGPSQDDQDESEHKGATTGQLQLGCHFEMTRAVDLSSCTRSLHGNRTRQVGLCRVTLVPQTQAATRVRALDYGEHLCVRVMQFYVCVRMYPSVNV